MIKRLLTAILFLSGQVLGANISTSMSRTGTEVYYYTQGTKKNHTNHAGRFMQANDALDEHEFQSTSDEWLSMLMTCDKGGDWTITGENSTLFDMTTTSDANYEYRRFNIHIEKGKKYLWWLRGFDAWMYGDFVELIIFEWDDAAGDYLSKGRLISESPYWTNLWVSTTVDPATLLPQRAGTVLSAGIRQRIDITSPTMTKTYAQDFPVIVNEYVAGPVLVTETFFKTAGVITNDIFHVTSLKVDNVEKISQEFWYPVSTNKTEKIDDYTFSTVGYDPSRLNFSITYTPPIPENPSITTITLSPAGGTDQKPTSVTINVGGKDAGTASLIAKWWFNKGSRTIPSTGKLSATVTNLPANPASINGATFNLEGTAWDAFNVWEAGDWTFNLELHDAAYVDQVYNRPVFTKTHNLQRTAPILSSISISSSSPYGTPTELTVGWSAPVNWLAS